MSGEALPDIAGFTWTATREKAAGLVADARKTEVAIATEAGISERTLRNWKAHPVFAARVDSLVTEAKAAAKALTIANKERRVARLQDRSAKLDQVIAARAEEHATVPGGDTGLLVREPKIVKVYNAESTRRRGPSSVAEEDDDDERLTPTGGVQIVYEYRVDTGTLAEMRQIEKQAAQEVGEWIEKVAPTKGDGSDLTLADLLGLARGRAD